MATDESGRQVPRILAVWPPTEAHQGCGEWVSRLILPGG